MAATYLDRDGIQKPILIGCYGIGLGRLLAAAIEQHHDEQGTIWPAAIAPYQAHLVGLNMANEAVAEACECVYDGFQSAGVAVLFDDRQKSAGVKFKDADLLGMPVRVTISPRTLAANGCEVMLRGGKQSEQVALDRLIDRIAELLGGIAC